MQTDTSLFIAGVGIGLGIAVIGGLFDYWLGNRNKNQKQTRQLPGCMVYLAGILGLVGVLAIIVSLIVERSIGPAVFLGAGVLGGFYGGFALMMLLYLLVKRYWPKALN